MAEKSSSSKDPKKTAVKKTVKKNSATKTTKSKSKTTKKDKQMSKAPEEKSFVVEAAENIETGAQLVVEKTSEAASEIIDKSSEIAGNVYEKVKEGLSSAYDLGAKAVESITETAQDYAKKYEHKNEIQKLVHLQDENYTKLGSAIFDKYKVTGIPADQLFKEKELKDLIDEIEKTANQIVKLGKKLDKLGK